MDDPRISVYELRYACRLLGRLGTGAGQDGFVMRSDRLTAVKFLDRQERFQREVEVYRVLVAKGIASILGHAVPRLRSADEELSAIEMSLVSRPFILDFAGARLPSEFSDFPPHVVAEHHERLRELFGDRWTDVLALMEAFFGATGFIYCDPHPGNIAFADPGVVGAA